MSKIAKTPYEDRAVERLRATGHRITTPRLIVIRVLSRATRALSAADIHREILAQNFRVDMVSVYRVLGTLAEIGLVHHVGLVDAYRACTSEDFHDENQEHLVCSECGGVTEIPFSPDLLAAANNQLRSVSFKPSLIKLEIRGICENCDGSSKDESPA